MTIQEIVIDWVIPPIGGALTYAALMLFTSLPVWAVILLALPGALLFQWALVLSLVLIDAIMRKRK